MYWTEIIMLGVSSQGQETGKQYFHVQCEGSKPEVSSPDNPWRLPGTNLPAPLTAAHPRKGPLLTWAGCRHQWPWLPGLASQSDSKQCGHRRPWDRLGVARQSGLKAAALLLRLKATGLWAPVTNKLNSRRL